MPDFSLLIKPAGADCNLRCRYCFYLDRAALYPENKVHRMDGATLEALIRSYMATAQGVYAFGWQGGEPTLMGLDFFKQVTRLQEKHGRDGAVVSNGLQTNATLITDPLARHLGRYRFLLGVSLDGPAALHDRFRQRPGGAGTHAEVMAGIRRLEAHNVSFNILTLVSQANAGHGAEVYRYLTGQGWLHHQYIPCVEFDAKGQPLDFAINGGQWGEFLCTVFDEWIKTDTRRVSIRYFDALLACLINGQRLICHMGRDCRQYFVVEHNGDVYPCDFFVRPELKLGNIHEDAWDELLASPAYAAFGLQKLDCAPQCADCAFMDLCQADCLKHRLIAGDGPRRLSWLCEGTKLFLGHALDALKELARQEAALRQARPPAPGPRPAGLKTGRNDACPCGSGLKFKRCCGRYHTR